MARNGGLDTRTLVRVDGWALLAPATAASWVAACNEMVALGYPRPTITAPDGAYRDLAGQRYWKAYWTARGKPGNAATPGHSNHGWGTAIDLYNVYRYYRPDLIRVFAKHGFTFNVPSELWHVQHNGTWPAGGGGHAPIPTPAPTPEPIPEPEEDDTMRTGQIHYTDTTGKIQRALFTPGTGYFLHWQDNSAGIANGFAAAFETGDSVEVTASMFTAIKNAATALQK